MDQKDKIKKVIGNMVKNTNFYYLKAKESRIKNRKQHDLNKEIKNKQKTLSKDRFHQYIKDIYKQ
jgi:hypothetical protein